MIQYATHAPLNGGLLYVRMNAIASNIKIYGITLGCMACGAMMSDIVDSLRHHKFQRFYAEHPIQFWCTIPINLMVVYLLVRRARQISQERRDPAMPQEKAGVGASPVSVKFQTTPFIRICLYSAFYIIGICLVFLF
jgi:hypothetical protein